jgi:hypothetical protein
MTKVPQGPVYSMKLSKEPSALELCTHSWLPQFQLEFEG